jgi:HEAT repeat protein
MNKLLGILGSVLLLAAAARAADVEELVKNLGSKDSDVRRAAAKSLGEIGMEAKPALPALVKALKDDDKFVRRFSAQSIGELGVEGKTAVPALTAALKDPAKEVVDAATTALVKMGPDGVTPLTDLLKDKKRELAARKAAAEAFGSLGKDVPKSVVTALTDALKDNEIRIAAVMALGELGPEAKFAEDAITASLKDNKDRNYRRAAQESLRRIQGKK